MAVEAAWWMCFSDFSTYIVDENLTPDRFMMELFNINKTMLKI